MLIFSELTWSDVAIGFSLSYLEIGAVIWVFVFSSGVAAEVKLKRLSRGKEESLAAVALASVGLILLWPWMVGRRGRV